MKTIPKWDWVISTGFYENDVAVLIDKEKKTLALAYEKNIKELLLASFLSTIILLGISFYISYLIEKKFTAYTADI